jgi:VanZ family protein
VIRLLPRRALLPIAYMLLVIALSSIPQRELNAWGLSRRMWDLGHIPLYASFAFALSDEIHQNFVPGRVFSWVDLGADAFGIALGIALGLWTWSGVTEKGKSAA